MMNAPRQPQQPKQSLAIISQVQSGMFGVVSAVFKLIDALLADYAKRLDIEYILVADPEDKDYIKQMLPDTDGLHVHVLTDLAVKSIEPILKQAQSIM